MIPFLLLAIFASTASLAQTRYNSFVGCATDPPGSRYPGTSTFFVGASSPATCATACAGSQYSYYRSGDFSCFCSNTSPPSNFIVDSTTSSNCQASAFSTYRVATTFQYLSCGLVQNTQGAGANFVTSSMDDCFTTCRFTRGVFVFPIGQASTSEFQCACAQNPSFTSTTCGPGTNKFYFYTHTQDAASAGLTRRRAKLGRPGERYCPAGMTACRIAGSEDGYECIDTMSELESCGGCVLGQYGTRKRGVRGVNCASLGSDDSGSMTCKSGRCVDAFQMRR